MNSENQAMNAKCSIEEFNISKELSMILDELRGISNNLSDVLGKIECAPSPDCAEAECINDIKGALREIRRSVNNNRNMAIEINTLL